jgi:hypothetical protein
VDQKANMAHGAVLGLAMGANQSLIGSFASF